MKHMIEPFTVLCPDTSKVPRDEWLPMRKPYQCSSDVAAEMGMSMYGSPYSVACDKLNLVPEHDQSAFFEWKLKLEVPVLDWVEAKGWCHGPLRRHMMIVSDLYPWLASNPDALSDEECVEVKNLHGMDEKRWDEGIPDQYVIQAHVHMICSGFRECLLPVSFGGGMPREFWLDYDCELADTIIARSKEFSESLLRGEIPDPDASEATMTALRERYYESTRGEGVELPPIARPWRGLRDASLAVIAKETENIDSIKVRVMDLMGKETEARLDGEPFASWRPNVKGTRIFRFA